MGVGKTGGLKILEVDEEEEETEEKDKVVRRDGDNLWEK